MSTPIPQACTEHLAYDLCWTGDPQPSEPDRSYANDRERCLATAMEYTQKDRNAAHGNPENNFENIARYWNAHLQARYSFRPFLDATDVALMMAAMKMARLSFNPTHEDSWIDLAGYAACGMEISLNGVDKPDPLP